VKIFWTKEKHERERVQLLKRDDGERKEKKEREGKKRRE